MKAKWVGIAVLLIWLLTSLVGPSAASASQVSPQTIGEEVVGNDAIEVVLNRYGQWTIGSVAGDPATPDDDGKRLMYGHGRSPGAYTSFVSARVIRPSESVDIPLVRRTLENRQAQPTEALSEWELDGVRIEQVLAPALNPYTNRQDTVGITITATNTTQEVVQVGIRLMIDTMIGENDDAPFFVPGTGNFAVEREYSAVDMPIYWKAFEDPDYGEASLKGQGLLIGNGATTPDRFVVARWHDIKSTVWDYDIRPGEPLGDSAVAMYWQPVDLQPGGLTTWVTFYGLAGEGGGNAWIDAPVSVTSDAPEFDATLWVANMSDEDLRGGQARLTLPPGLALAAGETEAKPMDVVTVNGGARSVSWRLVAGGTVDADFPYSGTVTFDSGSGPLTAEASVHLQIIAAPTAAPTATPTATPVPILPVAVPVDRPSFPWWLLLLPLLLLPLLLLLMRRSRVAPSRIAPPRTARPAPPTIVEQPKPTSGRTGADVTHGRKKGERDEL